MSLFTGDIVAMYPNIDLEDAFQRISKFLETFDDPDYHPLRCNAIIAALKLIMQRNCFKFGDTFWLQKDGTAMGTPPAPSFATLYYGIFEMTLLHEFGPNLLYLRRFIDDQFGIWIHDNDPQADYQRWQSFKDRQQNFYSLQWEFSSLSKSVNFLDLSIHLIDVDGIKTTLYEKPLNLHLYIPWNSAHTPSVRSSVVISGVYRILRLVSQRSDQIKSLSLFFNRLLARGYNYPFLHRTFQKAFNGFALSTRREQPDPLKEAPTFLHLPYHGRDPNRKRIQQAFHEHIMHPVTRMTRKLFAKACSYKRVELDSIIINGWERVWVPAKLLHYQHTEPDFDELQNHTRARIHINRLIIAYNRPPNLKNLLFPRHVESKCASATSVSTILEDSNPTSNEMSDTEVATVFVP